MLNRVASDAFQSFSDSIRSKALLFYDSHGKTATAPSAVAEEETSPIQPLLRTNSSHIHPENSPEVQQEAKRPMITMLTYKNMAPALDVKIPDSCLDGAFEHSTCSSDSGPKPEPIFRPMRSPTMRVPSDAYEGDIEGSSESGSEIPSMGSRYKWNQTRAIRDNRYQAIQKMESVDTCSDVDAESDLELVRLWGRSPSPTLAAEQIEYVFEVLTEDHQTAMQYDPDRAFNAARLPLFNSKHHMHKEDCCDEATRLGGVQMENMREEMIHTWGLSGLTENDQLHKAAMITALIKFIYHLEEDGQQDAVDDCLDA